MKIECTVCGHKFDPGKSGGSCPKCGCSAGTDQIEEVRKSERVKGEKLKDILRSYLNERLRRENKRSPLRTKKAQIILCSCLALCIGGVIFYGVGIYKDSKEDYIKYKNASDIKVENYDMGDEIMLHGSVIRIVECKKADYIPQTVTEGYKLIEISYQRQPWDGDYGYSHVLSDAYLKCGEQYIVPVDSYTLKDLFMKNEDELDLLGYADYFQTAMEDEPLVGILVFAVPEDRTEFTLSAVEMTSEKDYTQKAEKRIDISVREEAAQ